MNLSARCSIRLCLQMDVIASFVVLRARGVNSPRLPWPQRTRPRSSPFGGGDNRLGVRVPKGRSPRVALPCVHRQHRQPEPWGIACRVLCQSRFPTAAAEFWFLPGSALQFLKPYTMCIYLSFHFHRLCVPYTHHWQWLMSFTVWFHRNCLHQKALCISLNKSSVININARCPRCTLSLDLCS